MRIRRKFLQLTKRTYPYGSEEFLERFLPKGYQKDKHGNYFIKIGDSSAMFTSHLDTACQYNKEVKHVFDKNYVKTNGETILGADDKAGVTVMLYMIEKNVPGLYYFFIGEEVGCVGSSKLSADTTEYLKPINKVISFDRRGTHSIITHQMMGYRCCSDDFATELSNRLNNTKYGLRMVLDDGGVTTDSAQFMGTMPECTNISVGYYKEHTTDEKQDLQYLVNLCKACVDIDWETLPVTRDPKDFDYDDYYYYYGYGGGHCQSMKSWNKIKSKWEEEEKQKEKPKESCLSLQSQMDNLISDFNEYDEKFYTYVLQKNNTFKRVYVSQTWVNYEKTVILSWLEKNGFDIDDITWNGDSCWTICNNISSFIGSRTELTAFIDKLSEVPNEHIREVLPKNIIVI